MSTPKFEMESSFSDASDINYDRAIDSTRKVIGTRVNPCDVASDFSALVTKLKGLKMEYYRLPVIEGYCFNLVTPNRDRIQRRIDTLEGEQGVFFERCKRFQEDEARQIARIEAEANKMKAEAKFVVALATGKEISTAKDNIAGAQSHNEELGKLKAKR